MTKRPFRQRLPVIRQIVELMEKTQRIENDLLASTRNVEHEREEINARVNFLNNENIRLNQVIRELIAHNRLRRSGSADTTKSSFDWQWREIPAGSAMPSNRAFLDHTPDRIVELFQWPADAFRGRRFLDAGCGSGRWSYGLLSLGAAVTSIDQSEAGVAATRELNGQFADHIVLRADLLDFADPPEESFDGVWCYGVCHHTEDLLLAMRNVMKRVKRGGRLFMMLYGYPSATDEFVTTARYEAWRQKLAPLSYAERLQLLASEFPHWDQHGAFDAMSPPINELVTWDWIRSFMGAEGFVDVRRTIDHLNHHFVATRA